jgi:hypothetical protein
MSLLKICTVAHGTLCCNINSGRVDFKLELEKASQSSALKRLCQNCIHKNRGILSFCLKGTVAKDILASVFSCMHAVVYRGPDFQQKKFQLWFRICEVIKTLL